MAATNLTELFTDVADAIREKDGSTEAIAAADFPTRILALATGGGFNLDDYDVVKLSRVYNNPNGYFFDNWSDYITDVNDIEVMLWGHGLKLYCFIKNVTGTFDENKVATFEGINFGYNGLTSYVNYFLTSTSKYQFTDTGFGVENYKPGVGVGGEYKDAIYLLLKKQKEA